MKTFGRKRSKLLRTSTNLPSPQTSAVGTKNTMITNHLTISAIITLHCAFSFDSGTPYFFRNTSNLTNLRTSCTSCLKKVAIIIPIRRIIKPDKKRGIKEKIVDTLPFNVLIKTLFTLSIFSPPLPSQYEKYCSFCQIDNPFAYMRVNLVKLGSVQLKLCGTKRMLNRL